MTNLGISFVYHSTSSKKLKIGIDHTSSTSTLHHFSFLSSCSAYSIILIMSYEFVVYIVTVSWWPNTVTNVTTNEQSTIRYIKHQNPLSVFFLCSFAALIIITKKFIFEFFRIFHYFGLSFSTLFWAQYGLLPRYDPTTFLHHGNSSYVYTRCFKKPFNFV